MGMTEQEHEQHSEKTAEEQEETLKDLDVPEDDATDVKGGSVNKIDIK
jgi:hypothetical protein